MIITGEYADLAFERNMPQGWYLLDAESGDEVLLPNKYCPEDAVAGDQIRVFIYRDSHERLVATTLTPKVNLHEFACLEVVSTTELGSFMDWGMEKDLFVPFQEQYEHLEEGQKAVIFMYRDEHTDRLVGSARIKTWLRKENIELKERTKVELRCFEISDIGYKMIVNEEFQGMVFKNETFVDIEIGQQLPGYVRTIREDGLIDLSLNPIGRNKVEGHSLTIITYLEKNRGFMKITDKTSPEIIKSELQMSKKSFKEAVGKLYKSRLISLDDNGVWLIQNE